MNSASNSLQYAVSRADPVPGDQTMTADLAAFLDYYERTILQYLGSLPEDALGVFTEILATAVSTEGNTMYFFGNGGSNAIARHLEYALRSRFHGLYPVRVTGGADFHAGQFYAASDDFTSIFESILDSEQIRRGDLSVFISGSGDSDNLLRAADYCRTHAVQSVSFSGFDGGKISRPGLTGLPFVVRIHDQQLSEDVIQILMHTAAELTYRRCVGTPDTSGQVVKQYMERIAAGFERIHPDFMERVSRSVCEAFLDGRDVYLLAPEGPPLSLSAEHIAHNLNWDAVYQVPHPPRRRLNATPTTCDYTGIGNDRLAAGVVSRQQLHKARSGDVLILFARDPSADIVRITLDYSKSVGMSVYLVTGGYSPCHTAPDTLAFGSDDPEVLADCGQSFGHMLGRVVRMRLLQAVDPADEIADPAAFLIGSDLAQRRLINATCGV
jgi:D-sedoheptulose 7-phosphate isomerase